LIWFEAKTPNVYDVLKINFYILSCLFFVQVVKKEDIEQFFAELNARKRNRFNTNPPNTL